MVKLLNLLREQGARHFPIVGALKLGTGNGWARVTGCPRFSSLVRALSELPRQLPTTTYDLVEVEGRLCHFTGVGWDARILNDYLRNVRSSRIPARLREGIGGYLFALFRYTIPEEFQLLRSYGQARVRLENLGGTASTLDARCNVTPLAGSEAGGPRALLFEGPLSVGAAGTSEEWGFGFRAFPYARRGPRAINIRVYDRPVGEATRQMLNLWRGRLPQPGMTDWYATHVRMTFSRPVPFQMGGDGEGLRETVEFRLADETVQMVDWRKAFTLAGQVSQSQLGAQKEMPTQ